MGRTNRNGLQKKILIFTPGGVGGAERMSALIGKLLPRDMFEVKYVVIGRLRNIYNILPEGYEVDCIPVWNKYAFSTVRIWWKIMREKPDVVFASQVAYNPRVIIASKLAGRKVVIRSSGMIGHYPAMKLWRVKFTYPWADKLIAQQEDMRKEMIKILKVDSEKVVTLHNPLDCPDIDQLSAAPSPYSDNDDVIFVETATVNHRKAQDVAIKAFSIVKKSIPNAHLYFVGKYDENGTYYQEQQKLVAEFDLKECIHFIGYDKNPFKWVKNANCFVFPSRAEGLPNALIEASYLGLPCVASRCLPIVDAIIKEGQNGYVVDVDDVEGMAQAMIKAVNIKDCKMIYSPGKTEDFVNVFEFIDKEQ